MSLLPGLRDLRAPLAAGYVWLLFGWLLVETDENGWRALAPDLVEALEQLGDRLTPAGVALVVSFTAYLIGVLSIVPIRLLAVALYPTWLSVLGHGGARSRTLEDETISSSVAFGRYGPFLDATRVWMDELFSRHGGLSAVGGQRAWKMLKNEALPGRRDALESCQVGDPIRAGEPLPLPGASFGRARGSVGADMHAQTYVELWLAQKVAAEREVIADGLLDEKSDLYGPIDRLRGEIDFRVAVWVPLAAVAALLYVRYLPEWWVLALAALVVAAVLLDTERLIRDRVRRIGAALITKPTRSPTLNRIERSLAAQAPEPTPPLGEDGGATEHGSDQTPAD